MSKKLLLIFTFLIVLFFQIPFIKKSIIETTNSMKNSFASFLTKIKQNYKEYIWHVL